MQKQKQRIQSAYKPLCSTMQAQPKAQWKIQMCLEKTKNNPTRFSENDIYEKI